MTAVSLIIPTYNRAHLLAESIQSVLNQTWTDFELIVVDDGSTDNTASVVAEFTDRRVCYLPVEHGERSVARNHGLAAATGDYVVFLDDDDLCFPHRLSCQVEYLNSHQNVDVVASGYYIQRDGDLQRITWPAGNKDEVVTLMGCLCGRRPNLFACMFRRSLLEHMDYWFDTELILAEDSDFVLRLILACGERAVWLPEKVYIYRVRRNSPTMDVKQLEPKRRLLLDKFFARSDIPAEIQAQHSKVYIWNDVIAACVAYSVGQPLLAQFILLKGLIKQPELRTEGPDIVVSYLTSTAKFQPDVRNHDKQLINRVFDHLPTPLQSWEIHKDKTLARIQADALMTASEDV